MKNLLFGIFTWLFEPVGFKHSEYEGKYAASFDPPFKLAWGGDIVTLKYEDGRTKAVFIWHNPIGRVLEATGVAERMRQKYWKKIQEK